MTDSRVVDHDVGHAVLGGHPLGELLDGVGIGDVKGVGVRNRRLGRRSARRCP